MDGKRALRGSGFGDRQLLQHMGGATWRGNFGADDVDGRRAAPPRDPVFGNPRQAGGPRSRQVIRERLGLAGTAHGGVEMDLAETGVDIGRDHDRGTAQRLFGRQRLPGIGAEMVAAQDEALHGEADACRDPLDEQQGWRGHSV